MKHTWKRIVAFAIASVMTMGVTELPVWAGDDIINQISQDDYLLNYIYIDGPVLYQNEEQVVGVNIENLDSHMSEIDDIRLGYTVNDVSYEIAYSEVESNVAIFKSVASQVGTYQLDYVDVEEKDGTHHFNFAEDEDIAIQDAIYYAIEDTCVNELEEETSYQISEYAGAGLHRSVLTDDGIQFDIQEMNPVTSNGQVVVVLDPGHDSKHTGAAGNGLHEEILTLKIAKYCKAELETYNNIKVYMTREDGTCIGPESHGDCLKNRCSYAAKMKANILVSIHINAGSSTASGALVIVAKRNNYRDDLAKITHEIGQAIMDELTKLGLADRGLYVRMSDSRGEEYVYPNGATADYYGITRNCMKNGIPGIIVEHCFISNASDAEKYLKSEAKLRNLGVADATGIAKYFKLSKKKGNESHDVGEALYDNSPEPYEIKGTNISDFVATVYKNALLRTPKRSEVSYWVRKIEMEELTGTQLVSFFIGSPEFANKNYTDEEYVNRLYEVFLNRTSDEAGRNYWVSLLQTKSRAEVARTFAVAPEFTDTCVKYGMKQGEHEMQYVKLYPIIGEVVSNYYTGLMGRKPDSAGLEYWSKYIILGGSVSDLSKLFIYSDEFLKRDINKEDFVKGVYLTYLMREPDEAGLNYWVAKLGDMTDADKISVIRGFVFSPEYRALCEKYGINMGSL